MEARRRFLAFVVRPGHRLPASAKTGYIGAMTDLATGSLADLIAARLTAALAPSRLVVANESAMHAGHMGDDGTGETHYRVEIESPAFAGATRVARQRLVNHALADLLATRIHALAIRASAPGE
jgi:BolA protein